MLLPIIIAGGTGSRLWPMSRELYPKQFLKLYGKHSMLQETILRLEALNVCLPIVICNNEHRFLVAEQLRQIKKLSQNIILEPIGRNTAPAIALAALNAISNGSNPLLLVMAADHIIENISSFHLAIKQSLFYGYLDNIVMFGIPPIEPETGYGYIHRGEPQDNKKVFRVKGFIEKPDKKDAENYINSGEYYWNSGIFSFRAKKYLSELNKFRPDILSICKKAIESPLAGIHEGFIRIDDNEFVMCPDESVDYAIMEKTKDAIVIPLDAGWNDIGSWSNLWKINKKDNNQNVITGNVFLHNTICCYIHTNEKIIAAIGLNNLVIVNTKDAILIVNKDKVQDVKKAVEYLKTYNFIEHHYHHKTYQVWGCSNNVINEANYNINHVIVNPGGMFSLQIHHYRTEHWIILSGTAKVIIENKSYLLNKNSSASIPVGSTHKLENPGKIPLELLEIQLGL